MHVSEFHPVPTALDVCANRQVDRVAYTKLKSAAPGCGHCPYALVARPALEAHCRGAPRARPSRAAGSGSHKVQADLPAISHKGLTDYLDNYVEM
jgi:hypothetical protein